MDRITPIFLLSLPRSGSTLLQRILSSHSQISTVSEPWLLLPPVYSLRPDGIVAEYGHTDLAAAINDFCDNLPRGRQDYFKEMGDAVLRLYEHAAGGDTRYFLDKTPRYHLICNELVEIFPNARFLIMWRNPLAVLSSIMETFHRGKWLPRRYEIDLFDGLSRLVELTGSGTGSFHTVKYEELVLDTGRVIEGICTYLDLQVEQGMFADLDSKQLQGRMGDHSPFSQKGEVSSDSLQKWQYNLNSPVRTRYALRYLNWLGQERLKQMDYDLEELRRELAEAPTRFRNLPGDLLRSLRGRIDRRYSAWR